MSKANPSLQFSAGAPSRPAGGTNGDTVWTPNTDVYIHAAGTVIKVELAGIRKEDLEISVEGKVYRTEPIKVRVLEAGQDPAGGPAQPGPLAEVELPSRAIYVGESFPAEARLLVPPGGGLAH